LILWEKVARFNFSHKKTLSLIDQIESEKKKKNNRKTWKTRMTRIFT